MQKNVKKHKNIKMEFGLCYSTCFLFCLNIPDILRETAKIFPRGNTDMRIHKIKCAPVY